LLTNNQRRWTQRTSTSISHHNNGNNADGNNGNADGNNDNVDGHDDDPDGDEDDDVDADGRRQ